MDLLKGYSDPEGYVNPESGVRYEDLDLSDRFPLFEKAGRIPDLLRYPNGRLVAVHDTWAWQKRAPTTETGPYLLGRRRTCLAGAGQRRVSDAGAPAFFGRLRTRPCRFVEHFPVFTRAGAVCQISGYTWTHQRQWASSTLSHSTVVVNGEDQARGNENDPSDGNLLLFVPGNSWFQAVAAQGNRAYPGVVRDYRRLLVMIGVSARDAYVVDVFRVDGERGTITCWLEMRITMGLSRRIWIGRPTGRRCCPPT